MDLLQQKRGIDLLYDLFIRGKGDVLRIPYTPSKTEVPAPVSHYFPRATPESRGIESDRLRRLLSALAQDRHVHMHAITVLCDGAVICEASAPGYDRNLPHTTYSMCKSVVGLAVGFLYDEGRIELDRPAHRYFPPEALPRLSSKMKVVTVRHLLTMTSGVAFAETGVATETDWVRAFFASDLRFEPGTAFAYNSMNTYILSALVRAITGEGLMDFLRPRLFAPLHIQNVFWETCPMGIEKGGWGLYIAQEDMAKIGHLCLEGGCFEGQRILSEAWLHEATTAKCIVADEVGAYHYGYQIWCAKEGDSYLFNGMLGQDTWVCPRHRMVVVVNAGNVELFQQSRMLALIGEALGTPSARAARPLRPDRAALRALRRAEADFCTDRPWLPLAPQPSAHARLGRRLLGRPLRPLPPACRVLNGRTYTWQQNNCGLLPLFVRLQQNNHTRGLRTLAFSVEGQHFYAAWGEGEEPPCHLEFGFYEYCPSVLTVRGECYRVACAARFTTDEEGRRLLMLHIVFPELAHDRRIKLYYEEETVCLRLRENPGKEIVSNLLQGFSGGARMRGLLSFLGSRMNKDYLLMRVYDKFEPLLQTVEEGGEPDLLASPDEAAPTE